MLPSVLGSVNVFVGAGVYLACGSAAGAISVSVVKEWSEMNVRAIYFLFLTYAYVWYRRGWRSIRRL